jgi:hypothetical protein
VQPILFSLLEHSFWPPTQKNNGVFFVVVGDALTMLACYESVAHAAYIGTI